MVGKLSLLLIMLFACAVTGMAQAFTYSYIDPCTGKKQYVTVNEPNGSITMSYNKFIKTFRIEDFNSGAFDSWLEQIKNNIPGNNPCGGVGVELTTETNTLIAMNTVTVTTTVVTTVASSVLSGVSDVATGAADVTSAGGVARTEVGSDGGEEGVGDGSSNKRTGNKPATPKKKKGGDGEGEDSEGGEGGDGEGSGEDGEGGDGDGGKEGEDPQSSEGGEGSDGSGGNGESGGEESGGGGELSGGSRSANAASKQKNGNVRKGNIIATGDIVAIQNQSTDDAAQFRINASMIYSDSKKIWTYGGLLNFTTAINNSSITAFGSYRWKKLTTVLANSTMINFEKDLFNTTSIIAMYPVWKLGIMAGGNATYGMFGTSSFTSYSALAGMNGTVPLGKFNLNLMLVGLYSPYTFYYEGMWHKTNVILVPFASVDYAVTKTFKFNISFSSVYEVKNNVLNYQVLLGGKYLF